MGAFEPVLTRYIEPFGVWYRPKGDHDTIDGYLRAGGYRAWTKVLKEGITPEALIEQVKQSGLRGRGGAGFPTGLKWSFVPKDPALPKYLCVNADESEPGTFKDRMLMECDPHQVIEGSLISAYAIGARRVFVYIRGEMQRARRQLERAVAEAYAKGYAGRNILGSGFDCDLLVHPGAGVYIAGEETGLIESLEGKAAMPRVKPPFPAVVGLYGKPTVVNNVETLCNVVHIVERGVEWYRTMGTEKSPGPRIFCLSGHVNRPGNYEAPMGIPLRQLIFEMGGGIRGDRRLKAVIPGGSSTAFLTEAHLDVTLDHEATAAAGSGLGSAGVIVMDETTCMVGVCHRLMKFYRHESCGKCTPCREGTDWLAKLLGRIEAGGGVMADFDVLDRIPHLVAGHTICALADGAVPALVSALKYFRDEFEMHIRDRRCPYITGRVPAWDIHAVKGPIYVRPPEHRDARDRRALGHGA
ncbi:MAG TPA: NADH-quinone oxidoreductase subunit NuoF [Thermodesulfobacteriota bacterium]|nr:NADH-quinone oxidoreductase subunit NuoF [Thermodesulfobacteriota bacterium]